MLDDGRRMVGFSMDVEGIVVGKCVPFVRFSETSRKLTVFKSVFMEIERPYCLKWTDVVFLRRSASGPDAFFSKARPSSL